MIQHVKRCWISGWTGFFSPNLPVYVAPSFIQNNQDATELSTNAGNINVTTEDLATKLSDLLNSIKQQCTVQKLDELIPLSNQLAIKHPPAEELNLRSKIDNQFHELLIDTETTNDIVSWLVQNQHVFMKNRFFLLTLGMRQGSHLDLNSLIEQINQDSDYLQENQDRSCLNALMRELNGTIPELKTRLEVIKEEVPVAAPEPVTLETVSAVASNAWSWAMGNIGSFFSYSSQLTPAEMPNNNASAPSIMQ